VPAKPAKAVANRAYYLGRLEREFPALAARTRTGELSVYRASIEAGLRKPPARNWAQPDAYRSKPSHSSSHVQKPCAGRIVNPEAPSGATTAVPYQPLAHPGIVFGRRREIGRTTAITLRPSWPS
jgi:hypothetical protein